MGKPVAMALRTVLAVVGLLFVLAVLFGGDNRRRCRRVIKFLNSRLVHYGYNLNRSASGVSAQSAQSIRLSPLGERAKLRCTLVLSCGIHIVAPGKSIFCRLKYICESELSPGPPTKIDAQFMVHIIYFPFRSHKFARCLNHYLVGERVRSMSVIVEFTIEKEDFALGQAFIGAGDVPIELEEVVPIGNTVLPFFWIVNPDQEGEKRASLKVATSTILSNSIRSTVSRSIKLRGRVNTKTSWWVSSKPREQSLKRRRPELAFHSPIHGPRSRWPVLQLLHRPRDSASD